MSVVRDIWSEVEVGGSLVRGPWHVGEKVKFRLFGITIFTSLKSRVRPHDGSTHNHTLDERNFQDANKVQMRRYPSILGDWHFVPQFYENRPGRKAFRYWIMDAGPVSYHERKTYVFLSPRMFLNPFPLRDTSYYIYPHASISICNNFRPVSPIPHIHKFIHLHSKVKKSWWLVLRGTCFVIPKALLIFSSSHHLPAMNIVT